MDLDGLFMWKASTAVPDLEPKCRKRIILNWIA